jgi:hypothetical protein
VSQGKDTASRLFAGSIGDRVARFDDLDLATDYPVMVAREDKTL